MLVVGWLVACTGEIEAFDTGAPTAPEPVGDVIPPEGAPVVAAYLSGPLQTLPAFAGVANVWGSALLVRKLDGTATLSLGASGLTPAVEHTAHVHTWPCAYEGGGHYYHDPAYPEEGETNEVWAKLTPDAEGNATTKYDVAYPMRGDALSVVVHDPATGEKLACADLAPEQVVGAKATGTFAPFAYYEPIDETITGAAELVMAGTSTVTVNLGGLSPADSYSAHVHVLPCEILDGGGHYKLDPSVVEALPDNEIWPTITVGPDGSASYTSTVTGHTIREDAAAVVIHRIVGAEVPKVACANLVREQYLPLSTFGQLTPLPAAGVVVGGSATLTRRMDGASLLKLEAQGLVPGAQYAAHLHELPCGVADGGGHFLYDPAQPDGTPGNELAVDLVAGADGTATRTVGEAWMARAEGQSVVLHSADGTRLACADLE
jgi:hypothetical protein